MDYIYWLKCLITYNAIGYLLFLGFLLFYHNYITLDYGVDGDDEQAIWWFMFFWPIMLIIVICVQIHRQMVNMSNVIIHYIRLIATPKPSDDSITEHNRRMDIMKDGVKEIFPNAFKEGVEEVKQEYIDKYS